MPEFRRPSFALQAHEGLSKQNLDFQFCFRVGTETMCWVTDLTAAISQPGWYGKNCGHFKIINLKEKKEKKRKDLLKDYCLLLLFYNLKVLFYFKWRRFLMMNC